MVKKLISYGKREIIRFFRIILLFCFHFDKWHIGPLSVKQYAQDIIKYLNCLQENNRQSVVEIGCGVGDIIRHLQFKKRFALDADANVLRAARFLSTVSFNGKINFQTFVFPQSKLNDKYDVIILVNWIHDIAPAVLKNKINEYFNTNLKKKGRIIIDTVQDKEYPYNHDINFLSKDLNCQISKIGDYERGRKVFAILSND